MIKSKGKSYEIYCADCRDVLANEIDKNSVHLTVTSPPYNARQEYESQLSEDEYLDFIIEVFQKIKRVLHDRGRICWNVAPTINEKNKEFPFPLEFLTIEAARKAGLIFWESIVWNQLHTEANTAWGSYKSPNAPVVRHMTERVLFFVKTSRRRGEKGRPQNEFKKGEFEELTLDLWTISPTHNSKHPCPFPVELAERCLKFLSFKPDTILDPFMGIGTVGQACSNLGRKMFIGIDKEKKYFKTASYNVKNLLEYF